MSIATTEKLVVNPEDISILRSEDGGHGTNLRPSQRYESWKRSREIRDFNSHRSTPKIRLITLRHCLKNLGIPAKGVSANKDVYKGTPAYEACVKLASGAIANRELLSVDGLRALQKMASDVKVMMDEFEIYTTIQPLTRS